MCGQIGALEFDRLGLLLLQGMQADTQRATPDQTIPNHVKLAVDASQLWQRVQRAKNVFTDVTPEVGALGLNLAAIGGATSIPHMQQIRAHVQHLKPLHGALERLGQPATTQHMSNMYGAAKGQVIVHPETIQRAARYIPGAHPNPHHDATGALVGAHELFERGVKKRDQAPMGSFFTHNAPNVLLKEHNLMSRMTGEGADSAVQTIRALRAANGEDVGLRGIVDRAMRDPRAQQFLAPGEKVPKAMRKAIDRRIRQDPNVLHNGRDPLHALRSQIPPELLHGAQV